MDVITCSGGFKGGARAQIFPISCSFWEKMSKIIGWRPPRENLDAQVTSAFKDISKFVLKTEGVHLNLGEIVSSVCGENLALKCAVEATLNLKGLISVLFLRFSVFI